MKTMVEEICSFGNRSIKVSAQQHGLWKVGGC